LQDGPTGEAPKSKSTTTTGPTRLLALIALYVRVSTAVQAEDGFSLDAQEAELRRTAAERWPDHPVRVFREAGKSGRGGKKRPQYDEMLSLARAGELHAILAAKPDRLGRNLIDWLSLKSLCAEQAIHLETLSRGTVDTSASGKLLDTVVAAFAEYESDIRSERNSDITAYLQEHGYWPGGTPPWGLERNPDGTLKPSSDSPLILAAFERVDQGGSIADAHRLLDGAAKQERETVTLDHTGKLLRNPTYAGWLRVETKTGGERLTEGRHGPAHGVEPLVPRDLFERVQTRLAEKERGPKARGQSPFGPNGRCGACNAILRLKRGPEGYAYIQCNDSCGHVKPIALEYLELLVVALLGTAPAYIDQQFASGEWVNFRPEAGELARLLDEKKQIETRRESTRRLDAAGALTTDEVATDLRETKRRLEELEPLIEAATRTNGDTRQELESLRAKIDHGYAHGRSLIEFWRTAKTDEKQDALAELLSAVYLLPSHVGLVFRYGLRTPPDHEFVDNAVSFAIEQGAAADSPIVKALREHTPAPRPIFIPIDRSRRKPGYAERWLELGFGVPRARPAVSRPHTSRQVDAEPASAEASAQSQPAVHTPPAPPGRSAGRSPSPPSEARRGRG
jgi:site-specific DNA recombinase